jgi:RHS repeat-associated protein
MGNRKAASLASQGGASLTYTANSVNQYTSISAQPAPVHDANGNLIQQNGNSYTWDSENRLLSVVPNTPAAGDKSLQYRYDAHHRRVTRTIQEWTGSAWASTGTTHFIYDGWNVIEEYQITSSTSTLSKTYTWGLDLSRSLQGAGGVGALLMAEEVSGSTTLAYHFHYDGNGNVTEITDAAGAQAASYRYDAFGSTLVVAGPYAVANRYRFSTKPLDAEVVNAPLYYYGYRFYDSVTGRWPSRDPIHERGGVNLYGMVRNSPFDFVDGLGRNPLTELKELGIGVNVGGQLFLTGGRIGVSVTVNSDCELCVTVSVTYQIGVGLFGSIEVSPVATWGPSKAGRGFSSYTGGNVSGGWGKVVGVGGEESENGDTTIQGSGYGVGGGGQVVATDTRQCKGCAKLGFWDSLFPNALIMRAFLDAWNECSKYEHLMLRWPNTPGDFFK